MSARAYPGSKGPHAEEIPVTPIDGFPNVKTVQQGLTIATDAASPGFSFGRQNAVTAGSWLLNESTPSNKSGRPVLLDTPTLTRIAVTNSVVNTYTIGIYEHDKTTFTLLDSITVTADFDGVKEDINVAVTKGKELAALLTSGNANDLIVTLSVRGQSG